jgi:hypothetical protein
VDDVGVEDVAARGRVHREGGEEEDGGADEVGGGFGVENADDFAKKHSNDVFNARADFGDGNERLDGGEARRRVGGGEEGDEGFKMVAQDALEHEGGAKVRWRGGVSLRARKGGVPSSSWPSGTLSTGLPCTRGQDGYHFWCSALAASTIHPPPLCISDQGSSLQLHSLK